MNRSEKMHGVHRCQDIRHRLLHMCRTLLPLLVAAALLKQAGAEPTAALPAARQWSLTGNGEPRQLSARYRGLRGDRVTLAVIGAETGEIEEISVPFRALSDSDQQKVLADEDTQWPAESPSWPDGYRIRYPLYVLNDLREEQSRSVVARIPTGGWVREDAADIVAQAADGTLLPVAVLAHDARGDTIVQFRRQGYERWYWVYAVHPDPPQLDEKLQRRIDRLHSESGNAVRRHMELQKQVGILSGNLREIDETIRRARETIANAEKEIGEWEKILPERETTAQQAAANTEQARAPVAEAEQNAKQAQTVAGRAVAEERAAQKNAATALQQLEAADEENRPAAEKNLDDARRAAAAAAENVLQARMAAAAAETKLAAARENLQRLQQAERNAQQELQQGRRAQQAARLLKQENEDIIRDNTAPRERLAQELDAARQKAAETSATAERLRAEYFDAAADANPRLLQEELTAEFRHWEGDELSDWAAVYEGLHRSDNVLGNMFPAEIRLNVNPVRRHDPRNFAASYRAYLAVEEEGVYSFFANSDDASFIFINGFLVHSRTGANPPVRGRVPVYDLGADIALEAGVHPIEVHHVVGNSPEAIGFCGLMWLTPGSRSWQYVPRETFTRALKAVPAGVEHVDGAPVAVILHGLHDTLFSDGVAMYPARFSAAGTINDDTVLHWDFGDGLTAAAGRGVEHVYFTPGDYVVSLRAGAAMPPFIRRINVWPTPVITSVRTLEHAVRIIDAMDFDSMPVDRLSQIFNFLRLCEQPHRWPAMERVCRRLLSVDGLDVQYRAQLHAVLMEAMARQGRSREALQRLDTAMNEVKGLSVLEASLLLQAADVQRVHLRDFREADRFYSKIIDEYGRLRHPVIRRAAVAWGDMFLQAGDTVRAGETYRLAAALGGDQPGESAVDAAGRGALLRIVEQQLRAGDLSHAQFLLERIENEFPEQKVEGLYRFLRAETGRLAGRYEEAVFDYEVVLQLSAWAGFHGPAMIGLADTHRRMRDYDRAIEWLDAVRNRFPDLYENRRLDDVRDMVEKRRAHIAEKGEDKRFTELRTGFVPTEEEGERERFAPSQPVRIAPALTIADNYAASFFTPDRPMNIAWTTELLDVEPESRFLVEFWMRDEFASVHAVFRPQVQIDLNVPGVRRQADRQTVLIEPYFGQWQKVAAILKGPVADRVTVTVNLRSMTGLTVIDDMRISAVSDSEYDALRRFIAGDGEER